MNKEKEDIIATTLQNLWQSAGVGLEWHSLLDSDEPADGEVMLDLYGEELRFTAQARKEIRTHSLLNLIQLSEKNAPFILIAWRLFPKLRKRLREEGVNYLEANGNIFLHERPVYIFVDGRPELPAEKRSVNRAFTKTGLKVIFQLLLDKTLINEPQREIASRAGVALGNIPKVIGGLLEAGHLVRLDKNNYIFTDRKALLERWMIGYADTLKPSLALGHYRWVQEGQNWQQLPIDYKHTQWGGEAAGELLTEYLRAENLTLYTSESRKALMTKYRLVPDEQGPIRVFQRFWEAKGEVKPTVPPLLVYADLMNTQDKRCQEAAEIIFKTYVQAIL